jgi:hypothetical protein
VSGAGRPSGLWACEASKATKVELLGIVRQPDNQIEHRFRHNTFQSFNRPSWYVLA